MSFWANAHKLGWATDAQLKRARELNKPVIANNADREYYKSLVVSERWTAESYADILGEEYIA